MTNQLLWLTPALSALVLYGVGQGLVKKNIGEIAPARFCLFFVVAKAFVNIGYWLSQEHPPFLSEQGQSAILAGTIAYLLDGTGWILYFKSIVYGPITIVGTLSAAYPAATIIFARIFLGEILTLPQYIGVVLIIISCIGLSYSPGGSDKIVERRWMFYAGGAILLWGAAQTLVKYTYTLALAHEANLALCNTIGGTLTLGVYGLLYGRGVANVDNRTRTAEWLMALLPMGMMAGGDLGVIIATRFGPVSIVTPLTAAYPLVTLLFALVVLKERISALQWVCIALILVGMFLTPSTS